MSFGSQLRRLRMRAGLSREVLAKRAEVSVATLAALESDQRRKPYPHTVVALAEALGLDDSERNALVELASVSDMDSEAAAPARPPSTPAGRARLPVPPTALIGRDADVAAAVELLDPARSTVRLLTLVGPGGVGKTRLAVAVARAVAPRYSEGVVFVDLAPLRDQRLVATAIARALGMHESSGRSAREQLLDHLHQQQVLLLLDNFEHLLGAAPLLAELLEACSRARLLVTSRAALRLRSEQRFRVAPLPVPAKEVKSLEALADAPAVSLFVDRAQAAASGFRLDAGSAQAVAAICRHLDGMPLAIELAAARVRLLQPEPLLQRLERRLPLLTGGAPELPERQQTLRQTLAWSHDLLAPKERMLFRRLAVFSGGWTLEAAEAICTGGELAPDDVFERLAELVNSSLVQQSVGRDQGPRFGIRETVREYAQEQLVISGELERARAAHAAFYSRVAEPLAVARTIAPWIVGQQLQAQTEEAIENLEVEFDNLQAALDWWLTERRPAEGLRLAVAFHAVWSRHGQYALGRRWLEAMLDLADRAAPASSLRLERAVALTEAGTLAGYQGDTEQARTFHQRSVQEWREVDHAAGLAIALANLGLAEWVAGEAQRAIVLLEEAHIRSRTANVPHTVAISARNLGLIARADGDYARAEALFAEAAAVALPQGWFGAYSLARSLSCLGRVAYLQHDLSRARALLRQAFETIRQAGVTGHALADCLDWQAALEAQAGDLPRAARLFGAADTHWRASGAHRYAPDESAYARDLAAVRGGLVGEALTDGWAEGAAMPPELAIAYALREVDSSSS